MVLRQSVSRPFSCLAIFSAIALQAAALEPEQLLEVVSASIVSVEIVGTAGAVWSLGSGIMIAPGEVITNCHVIEGGVNFRVRKGDHTSPAYLRFKDKPRDLCQLQAPLATSFTRPVQRLVSIDSLRVEQRVYAIGGPRGLELTLGEGLISALRPWKTGSTRVIQTTASIPPGTSGGGLFDRDGGLVGITSFMFADSQNINFALPAEWILELPTRQADLIDGKGAAQHTPTPNSQGRSDDGGRQEFGVEIARRAGQVRRVDDYPGEARQKRWEGTTLVRLQFGTDGDVKTVTVASGSGYEVLDDKALEIVRRIEIPPLPDALRGQKFGVQVPILFRLKPRS